MRHFILVVLATLTLASSALAEDVQMIGNVGPEVFTTSAMPEEEASALRTQPITFVPAPPRRTVHPAELGEIVATIMARCFGPINEYQVCHAYLNVPLGLPESSTVQSYITKPGGVRETIPGKFLEITPELAGRAFHGELWYGVFPADWLAGLVKISTIITADGIEREYSAEISIKTLPVLVLGPLTRVDYISDGSLFLEGDFRSSPVVVAPQNLGNKLIYLNGSFIPSSTKLEGEVVLVACDERSPYRWECSTQVLYLPLLLEEGGRNR